MSELNTHLEWLADYIVNNNHNYVGGEFEREDANEVFMVTVAKDSALRNLTEENKRLREAVIAALKFSEEMHYQSPSVTINESTKLNKDLRQLLSELGGE